MPKTLGRYFAKIAKKSYFLDFDTSKIKNKASHRCNGDLRPF